MKPNIKWNHAQTWEMWGMAEKTKPINPKKTILNNKTVKNKRGLSCGSSDMLKGTLSPRKKFSYMKHMDPLSTKKY